MQQKTIWLTVLIIGILINLLSCTKTVDKSQYEEFYYINNSNHDISITVFNKIDDSTLVITYNISVNEDLSQEIELMSGSRTGIISMCDSVTVKFGNERISHFIPNADSPYNILNYSNYIFLKKAENRNSYTYTFTEDDYENSNEQ